MRFCVTTAILVAMAILGSSQHAFAQRLGGGGGTMGQSGVGQLSATAGIGQNIDTNVGEVDSGARFLRQNRQAGEFVGAGAEDVQNFIGSQQAGTPGQSGRRSAARGGQGAGRQGQANRGRGRGRSTEIRSVMTLAFSYPKPAVSMSGPLLTTRLARLDRINTLSGLDVSVVGGTAVLRGKVATDLDRDLAEQLTRLEPGIWKIENQIEVAAGTNPNSASVMPGSAVPVPPVSIPDVPIQDIPTVVDLAPPAPSEDLPAVASPRGE